MSNRRQYLINILWGWMSAVSMILNGMLVAPYLIRKLGTAQYGIWALGLSLVEYFWLIDLGLRPATVKLTAEYRAKGDWPALNTLLSTSLLYSGGMGFSLMVLMSLNTERIARFFHLTDPAFTMLVHVISVSWAFGLVFNIFEAALEGFQRFDVTGRIFVIFLLIRSVALVGAATLGYGLQGMSIALLVTQLSMYLCFFLSLRSVYPGLKASPMLATRAAGLEIWRYARQLMSAMLAGRLLTSAIPAMITRFLSVQSLTYYSVTQKVLDYAGEGIGRVGLITAPRASDWMARGEQAHLVRMAGYGNRYCLMIWLIFATWMSVYADPLFRLWITPEFADHAAGLVPIMLIGYSFWLGQFVSASILMGVGWYAEYSAALMVEALFTIGGYLLVLPRFGLAGGVAWSAAMVFSNRFVNLSRIFAKKFAVSWVSFVWSSYRIPMALAAVDVVALRAVRLNWLRGGSWSELAVSGIGNSIVLGAAAYFTVLEPEHRALAADAAGARLRALLGRTG